MYICFKLTLHFMEKYTFYVITDFQTFEQYLCCHYFSALMAESDYTVMVISHCFCHDQQSVTAVPSKFPSLTS